MKETKKGNTVVREFSSLSEFKNYILTTPRNKQITAKASETGSLSFTGTNNFDEALGLFENGWDTMAKTLTTKVESKATSFDTNMVNKVLFDIVGFQASVPRYLQGIPTSMVNTKRVPVKQKVVTIDKDISYSCGISTQQIIEASTETLRLIKKIESQGVRVNLNLIWAVKESGHTEMVKVRLKSSGERLNISKLAFPLVNPSMLRRLFFRYVEVAPTFTSSFNFGYGVPLKGKELLEFAGATEYVLPRLFNGNISHLGNLSDVCELTAKVGLGK